VLDGSDVGPFVLAMLDPAAYQSQFPDCDIAPADMNGDGAVDGEDAQAFVDALFAP